MSVAESVFRCGEVALVGRPNVGKSTLLNALVGEQIAITASKPQTTRHRLLGVKSREDGQILYVDTPGLHRKAGRALNRSMNRVAVAALQGVDLACHLLEAGRFTDDDQLVLDEIGRAGVPAIAIVNKVDLLPEKGALLPYLQSLAARQAYGELVPVSALRRDGLERLEDTILKHLPIGSARLPEDTLTDRSERFLAAELVREQLMRQLGQEVPYATHVVVDEFQDDGRIRRISASIWVERDGQKAIVIGDKGARLKSIGTKARLRMEKLFDGKVHLELWVKLKKDWSDDERVVQNSLYREG